jgi:hypothetical protein
MSREWSSHVNEREVVKKLALCLALASALLMFAPVAQARMFAGVYELQIQGRYDFHTWLWYITRCTEGCAQFHLKAIPRPIAKAFNYEGDLQLDNGRYVLAVDVPDGLRCGDVYYGPTIPTHDVYSWDATTLAGTLESSFETGCNGAPGGTLTYPFALVKF